MRCPTILELPAPLPDKSGWPWTEDSPQLPEYIPDDTEWPKISIVTPNYNYGHFLEETSRSILLQGYPNLEYIIIDGGSTDNSVEIIKKYEPWITYWISELDQGQSNAINKGIKKCTGEIFNWVNSDDMLAKGALLEIGHRWHIECPHILTGGGQVIEVETGTILQDWQPEAPHDLKSFLHPKGLGFPQPSTFVDLHLLNSLGNIREDLHFVMDWELYLRFIMSMQGHLKISTTQTLISYALRHQAAKTSHSWAKFQAEGRNVLIDFRQRANLLDQIFLTHSLWNNKTNQLVSEQLSKPSQSLLDLIKLSIFQPYVVSSRLYWGTLKNQLKQYFRQH